MKNEGKYMISLETPRLLLRNIEPHDLDFIVGLWTDPEVTRYMGGPRDREKLIPNIIQNIENPFLDEYDLWPVVDRATGTPVGHCGLLDKEVEGKPEIEVVYVIAREHWGRGYAAEMAHRLIEYAFGEKKLNRVIALIKPDNIASEKVALKCGMKFEKEVIRAGNIKMLLYVRERNLPGGNHR